MTFHDAYAAWKCWNGVEFGEPNRDETAYCDVELGPLITSAKVRILEVGFGNGGVLGWCRKRGHDAIGVESNPSLVAKALDAGFNVVGSMEELRERYGDRAFDVAVAFDVLEHIPLTEIPGVLRSIHSLLKPEAILVIRVPNGDSPFGRASQHGDITHVSVLGSGVIQWLAAQTDFVVDSLKEPAIPLRGAGVLRKSKRLSARALRKVTDALISYAYFSGTIRIFSANLVAVLRASHTAGRQGDRARAERN